MRDAIEYVRGDATCPQGDGPKVICHVVNDAGGWGRGFVTRGSDHVPVRYEAIDQALHRLADAALRLGASIHMPRIGAGLAGGRWARIEPLIRARLVGRGLAVTVYDL
ncbi:hypothetical protein ACFYZH_11940 [Streptomyces abikoensis]|uniref:hypothetical protein n=1 Tax=Streptomyces abikoensis TaxID=97398 RepID=UPI003678889D